MQRPAPGGLRRSVENLAGRAPRCDNLAVRCPHPRSVELEQLEPVGDDDPLLFAIDRLDVLLPQEPVPSVDGLHGQRARLAVVSEPDLFDPADVAVRRLDDEPVGAEEPMSFGFHEQALPPDGPLYSWDGA